MDDHRTALARVAVVLVFVTTFFGATGCGESPASRAAICEVSRVEGTALVQLAGAAARVPLQRGQALAAGDRVVTEAKSSVALRYADFATVALGESTEFVVVSQKAPAAPGGVTETTGELVKGTSLANVKPGRGEGFTLKTRHVVTGVLGTCYGLECNDDETVVAVLQGRVRCEGGGGHEDVAADDGARCDGHVPPGLQKKYMSMKSKLAESLTGFFKEEAAGTSDLKTIFRYY